MEIPACRTRLKRYKQPRIVFGSWALTRSDVTAIDTAAEADTWLVALLLVVTPKCLGHYMERKRITEPNWVPVWAGFNLGAKSALPFESVYRLGLLAMTPKRSA